MRNVGILRSLNVSVTKILGTVAAWTLAYAGDMFTYTADTTDEVCYIAVPIEISQIDDSEGVGLSKIETIEVAYNVGTAALDAAVVAEIQSVAKAVDGAAPAVTTKACTVSDSVLSDTTTVDDHTIIITPDANLLLSCDANLILEVAFDKAATSTVAIKGINVNYKPIVG